MRRVFETAVILIGTLGWWGFVYPELCLTQENCQEAAADADMTLEEFLGHSGKFCIKSKVIEYLYQEEKKDLENDRQECTHRGV